MLFANFFMPGTLSPFITRTRTLALTLANLFIPGALTLALALILIITPTLTLGHRLHTRLAHQA